MKAYGLELEERIIVILKEYQPNTVANLAYDLRVNYMTVLKYLVKMQGKGLVKSTSIEHRIGRGKTCLVWELV